MPTAISSVINFLSAKVAKKTHNGPDLLERFLLHGKDMEVQVNVHAADGEPVHGKRSTYTDGINTWFNYRIPKNAASTPEFDDYELRWPLDVYAVGIGSTGWDWRNKRSRWVGFDFDSITGHAAGVGIPTETLDQIRDLAQALPYVEARKSTGGAGLHLYVPLDLEGVDINNHDEHAALARCILGCMSRDAGFDFQTQIDACGGNMWLWHRKSTVDNEGLGLIKAAEKSFTEDMLPVNWTDHIDVVTRKRAKVKLGEMSETEEDIFDQLATAHRRVPLDAKHKMIQDEIAAMGIVCVWVADHHLLQTHTVGFQRLMERKEELGLEGVFQTNSKGGDLATANCFAFPTDFGGWRINRFGRGAVEAPTWEQDGTGYTTCGFNVRPTLKVAARALGGRELSKGGAGYEFNNLETAAKVAQSIDPRNVIEVDETLKDRKAIIRKTKDGKLAIEIAKDKRDPDVMGQWNSTDKKNAWTQVYNIAAEPAKIEVSDYDTVIRRLETTRRKNSGWAAKKADGDWTEVTASEIKMILQRKGHAKPEAEQIMGEYTCRPWKLVMLPFQPEYPGNRQWNLDAPQYRFAPAPRGEVEGSEHPHWDIVLNHIGQDLDSALKDLEWAKAVGIRVGGDYLRAIFASILREPYTRTPYLFLFGPENSGKSIIHEAFSLLVTRGVVKADRALTNQSDFNGELEGAIVCVVEEKDISKASGALEKIKDAVTSPKLSIRRMRTDSFMADNMTHWIQCAQKQQMVPIFEGDTRITMMYVPKPETDIPKDRLMAMLEQEAPAFMRTLLDMELPPLLGRLRIPVVNTEHKHRAEQLNRSAIEVFVSENLHEAPGHLIPFADFFLRFKDWMPPEEQHNWSQIKTSRAIPLKFQTGKGTANKVFLINASWEPNTPPEKPYVVTDKGQIRRAV